MSRLRYFVNSYRFKKKSEDLKDKGCHWDITFKINYETFMFPKRNLFKLSL